MCLLTATHCRQAQVGRMVAVLSLSFLAGDALARVTLGTLSAVQHDVVCFGVLSCQNVTCVLLYLRYKVTRI